MPRVHNTGKATNYSSFSILTINSIGSLLFNAFVVDDVSKIWTRGIIYIVLPWSSETWPTGHSSVESLVGRSMWKRLVYVIHQLHSKACYNMPLPCIKQCTELIMKHCRNMIGWHPIAIRSQLFACLSYTSSNLVPLRLQGNIFFTNYLWLILLGFKTHIIWIHLSQHNLFHIYVC